MAEKRGEQGFSLVEMMVVLTIIAALLLAAIPTLVGATNRSKDVRARSAASLGIKTARSVVVQNYNEMTPAVLEQSEPSMSFVDGATPSSGPGVISATPITPAGSRSGIVVAVLSGSGACFVARYVMGEAPTYAKVVDANPCQADGSEAIAPGLWKPKP